MKDPLVQIGEAQGSHAQYSALNVMPMLKSGNILTSLWTTISSVSFTFSFLFRDWGLSE